MLTVDIKKKLGTFALEVAFETGGDITALLGASGCGKSMTLRCIAGIEKPDSGRIVLNGRVLYDSEKKINLTPQKRKVGYLFQHYSLFPNMTAAQNIALGAASHGKVRRRAAVAAMISSMRLGGLEKRRPDELSGGQKQRVALARILVSEPDALLLDEPFSALDDYLKWQLELELSDILKRFGGTTVFVSHSREEVYRLAERVCVLTDGKSERARDVRGLFAAPETLSACLISGCKNFSRARSLGNCEIEAVDWGVTLRVPAPPPDDIEYAGVRAHYIRPAAEPGENTIECAVSRVIDDIFATVVMLDAGTGTEYSLIRMELPKGDWAALGSPERILVSIDAGDIMPLRGS
ncbi:MAG: ATP-binding cassette domain-containing protein [Oscillospiraceae bacterium]|jgi:molybdate transport system ATP-binding protein|nr:ATP-binding cassette domain-containing protein [Oscillospiraceae bacterium]